MRNNSWKEMLKISIVIIFVELFVLLIISGMFDERSRMILGKHHSCDTVYAHLDAHVPLVKEYAVTKLFFLFPIQTKYDYTRDELMEYYVLECVERKK